MPVSVLTTTGTKQIKTGSGVLLGVILASTGTSVSIQIKDGPDSSGNAVVLFGNTAIVPTVVGSNLIPVPVPFTNGLQVVVGGTPGEFDVIWE